MFTGIVRHTGLVTHVRVSKTGSRLTIGATELAPQLHHGDSVCVNGVCLTVVEVNEALIEFDVIDETLRRSTLGALRKGGRVNLETSLRIGDTLDGHFVQGHVDGTAAFVRSDGAPGETKYWFAPDDQVKPYLIPKGSIAIDGISLTIADVNTSEFSVALIPTTLQLTTLANLRSGDRVNIESDIITRTILSRLDSITPAPDRITLKHLQTHGFA